MLPSNPGILTFLTSRTELSVASGARTIDFNGPIEVNLSLC